MTGEEIMKLALFLIDWGGREYDIAISSLNAMTCLKLCSAYEIMVAKLIGVEYQSRAIREDGTMPFYLGDLGKKVYYPGGPDDGVALDAMDSYELDVDFGYYCIPTYYFGSQESLWEITVRDLNEEDDESDDHNFVYDENFVVATILSHPYIPVLERFFNEHKCTGIEKDLKSVFLEARDIITSSSPDIWGIDQTLSSVVVGTEFVSAITLGYMTDNGENPVYEWMTINPSLNLAGKVIDEVIRWFNSQYHFIGGTV